MVLLSTCPKCGKQSRTRTLTVKSKKGKIYRYTIYYHRRRNHSVKITFRNGVDFPTTLNYAKKKEINNGPCPICGKKRRYYSKQIKVKAASGKIYQYIVYVHGDSKHFIRKNSEIAQLSDSERLNRLIPFLEKIMTSFTIGTKFTTKQLTDRFKTEEGLSYFTYNERIETLKELGFLTKSKEGGINYYSVPWAILDLIFRFVYLKITLYQTNEFKMDGHLLEFTIQNRSVVGIDYMPYHILTDQPLRLSEMHLEVSDSDTGELLKLNVIRNDRSEKLFYIKFREKLLPGQITKILIKYIAEETNKNSVFSSGVEIVRCHLCIIHNENFTVSFHHISSDRKTIIPLVGAETSRYDVKKMKQSCVDIDNPPKFSIIQVSWETVNQ